MYDFFVREAIGAEFPGLQNTLAQDKPPIEHALHTLL
jgi:hypothetical protein